MEIKKYDMFQKLLEKDIPPYVYAYPTRSAQREEEIDVRDIWEQEKNYTNDIINLYLHYPFCKYKCGFCNLYSVANNEIDIQNRYIEAMCEQLKLYKDIISKRKIKTIFLGGGTPMLIVKENIIKIVNTLDELYPKWREDCEEFCIEASPDSIVNSGVEEIKFLVDCGITRVNIGIQSFKKRDINNFGRSYEEDVNFKAIKILKQASVKNISTDLIAGFIGQKKEDFLESVKILTSLEPNTISLYHLRIRPDSKFGKEGKYNSNPNEEYYNWYEEARKIILAKGFKQDTNVRFIRENGGYLQQDSQFSSNPVLGIGAGARSYTSVADYIIGGSSKPSVSQIEQYINDVKLNSLKTRLVYYLNDEERIRRKLTLNLYRFDINEIKEKYGDVYDYIYKENLKKLIRIGMVSEKDGIYTLTNEGYKYRDIISWGFFSEEVQKRDKEFYLEIEKINKKYKEEKMEKLAILDCGGQYTKVIDRRVRELGVKSDILPISVKAEDLKGYKSIILSGGPNNISDKQRLSFDEKIFELGVPVLGICYGMQLMSDYFGGIIDSNIVKEYGQNEIYIDNKMPIFEGMEEKQKVLMSHGDTVKTTPKGFSIIGKSGEAIAAIGNPEKRMYGFQFHPEVDLTEEGMKMFENFIRKVAEYQEFYALDDRIETSIKMIKEKVGNNKVIVLVSGGVDSAVTAALLVKALDPENVYAIHVDSGFMRKNESDVICENLKELGLKNLIRENAKDYFFNTVVEVDGQKIGPLVETVDPETKRQIIGEIFIKIVNNVIERLGLDPENTFIAQGTLRPDLIESGNPDISGFAHKIKTHHNDVAIVREARKKGLIVETNSDWHKDEVRKVARKLGLEESIASRQPFPGPGLAIRLICHDKNEEVIITEEEVEKISKIVSESSEKAQIMPIKSVGVQGDARSYRNLSVLYGNGIELDWKNVTTIAKEITDSINTINRVAYILNKKNIDEKIKCFDMKINDECVDLLREVDKIVTSNLEGSKVSQTFAVLVPIGITKKYSVVIRTFVTNDFMTGRPGEIGVEVDKLVIENTVKQIEERFADKIEFVMYDVTSKPPATCEWQ